VTKNTELRRKENKRVIKEKMKKGEKVKEMKQESRGMK
jgi:hypothetical protein